MHFKLESAQLITALENSNQNEAISAGLGVLAAIGGTAASFNTLMIGAGLAAPLYPWAVPLVIVATAAQLVWQNRESFVWAGNQLLNELYEASLEPTLLGDLSQSGMTILVNTGVTAALNWVAPHDPLVLDLDGNGITTSAINSLAPILFDQNADGTKTATGWIAAGEAIVVHDLNGNGTIDSGRELFGDSTLLTRGPKIGETAADGFDALADLDADVNGVADGKFDSNDIAYSSVRLWQDANQDGISQAGELFTFEQLGVSSINVTGRAENINLGGCNTRLAVIRQPSVNDAVFEVRRMG